MEEPEPCVPRDDRFGRGGGKAGLKPGTYRCKRRTAGEEAWKMVAWKLLFVNSDLILLSAYSNGRGGFEWGRGKWRGWKELGGG